MNKEVFTFSMMFFLLLMGCSGGKEIKESTISAPPPPDWVLNRPIDNYYYIGIGSAPKSNQHFDYQQSAKKSALSDLASEISVNISGNSFLYTAERNSNFSEQYNSLIKSSTNEHLENYELVGTWEDQNKYWVFYRLSKSEFEAIKKERKQRAFNLAKEAYTSGNEALLRKDIKTAFNSYISGLTHIREFWGDDTTVDLEGNKVMLGSKLYHQLGKLTADLDLVTGTDKVILNVQNKFSTDIIVTLKNRNTNEVYSGLPVKYQYYGSDGKIENEGISSPDGTITIPIENADIENPGNSLFIQLNMDKILNSENRSDLIKGLLTTLHPAERNLAIRVEFPKIYIDSREKNLNREMNQKILSEALRNRLQKTGMLFTNEQKDADLIIKIESDTRKGNETRGFATAQLDYTLTLLEKKSGAQWFSTSGNNIKGVDLTFENAGIKAYNNAVNVSVRELSNAVTNAIF